MARGCTCPSPAGNLKPRPDSKPCCHQFLLQHHRQEPLKDKVQCWLEVSEWFLSHGPSVNLLPWTHTHCALGCAGEFWIEKPDSYAKMTPASISWSSLWLPLLWGQ